MKQFHLWLDETHVELKSIGRPQVELWLQSLASRGLHPSTRRYRIHYIHSYLGWLYDRGQVDGHPDDLIKHADLPKLPSYLPRPLQPEVDAKLQKRLAASEDSLWQALLLMRQTGIRIGELLSLPFDCTRMDPAGNRFLEVPLGKLNSERLVPLSEATYQIIRRLQGVRSKSRVHLLERIPGRQESKARLGLALRQACDGLELRKPPTTHQLRHTYATSLISGGMNLIAVMKLLGHRDYRMTLRYTAITQETVGREYFEALCRLENKYGVNPNTGVAELGEFDPMKVIGDMIAWMQNRATPDCGKERVARSMMKRLRRARDDLREFVKPGQP